MTVKGGDKVFKKLLNKMKSFKNICVAIAAGRIYRPYVRAAMEREKEREEQRQAGENIKYAKGGVIEPFKQQFEIDKDEKILTLEEWKKRNQALYMSEELINCMAAVMEAGVSADKMATSINKIVHHMKMSTERQEINNWRKMHGLPMMRNAGQRKKHKR